jgi:hypothetical protein
MLTNPRKFFPLLGMALALSLATPTFANTDDSYNDNNPQPTAARHTDDASLTSDEVPTVQASTLPADCVITKKHGEICGAKAANWCGKHPGMRECRHYKKVNHHATTDTDKTP